MLIVCASIPLEVLIFRVDHTRHVGLGMDMFLVRVHVPRSRSGYPRLHEAVILYGELGVIKLDL
jgi:hypothetical protein